MQIMHGVISDPALIEQYRRNHAPGGLPAAVTRALRASGIEVLEIYLCGNRWVPAQKIYDLAEQPGDGVS